MSPAAISSGSASPTLPAAKMWELAASAVARGLALFIALFTLLNLLLQWLTPGFDPNQWWIDFRPVWHSFESAFLLAAAGILLGYALVPKMPWLRRRITLSVCELLGLLALWNATYYFWLLGQHSIYHGGWFPFSFLVFIALLLVWRGAYATQQASGPAALLGMAAAFVGAAVAFPLGQIACFGSTDYRRQADAIVVFGAGVDALGRPSDALRDRVDLAVELYYQQINRHEPAPWLIFSGGKGPDEGANEAKVMCNLARAANIPDDHIEIDPAGDNTAATIENTPAIFARLSRGLDLGPPDHKRPLRILVVSHFFHLPRMKMAYQREEALGGEQIRWQFFTVPVRRPLRSEAHLILREVAAQWVYYLRALVS